MLKIMYHATDFNNDYVSQLEAQSMSNKELLVTESLTVSSL